MLGSLTSSRSSLETLRSSAVRKMMGTWAVAGSARRRLATSTPEMSGIITSRVMTSGMRWLMASRAALPFITTSISKPARPSIALIMRQSKGSSSTTRT